MATAHTSIPTGRNIAPQYAPTLWFSFLGVGTAIFGLHHVKTAGSDRSSFGLWGWSVHDDVAARTLL